MVKHITCILDYMQNTIAKVARAKKKLFPVKDFEILARYVNYHIAFFFLYASCSDNYYTIAFPMNKSILYKYFFTYIYHSSLKKMFAALNVRKAHNSL